MIKRSNLITLRLMAFAQVMKNVQSFLEKEIDLATLGLGEVKTEFDLAFSALENVLYTSQKHKDSEILLELDRQRDSLLINFIAHCKLFQNHPETAKKEAARRSVIQIEAYGKELHRRAYRDETAIIRNLVEDFSKSTADNDITLIGAKEWLMLLKPINERFEELHSDRTMEKSEKEIGKTKEMREKMQAIFDKLCKTINAMAFVKGEDHYRSLANAINEEVKNALVATK